MKIINVNTKKVQLQAKLFKEKTFSLNAEKVEEVKTNFSEFEYVKEAFELFYGALSNIKSEWKNVFNYDNLKLHDVARVASVGDFENFCMVSYDELKKYTDYIGVDFDYIGNTSSFMLNGFYVDTDFIKALDNASLKNFFYEFLEIVGTIDFLVYDDFIKGHLTYENSIATDYNFLDTLKEIEKDTDLFHDGIENIELDLKSMKEVKEYIEDFKENQINLFNEFVGEIND